MNYGLAVAAFVEIISQLIGLPLSDIPNLTIVSRALRKADNEAELGDASERERGGHRMGRDGIKCRSDTCKRKRGRK